MKQAGRRNRKKQRRKLQEGLGSMRWTKLKTVSQTKNNHPA
jgi:hypothetical protein